ncbi:IucA/IucC family protein [Cupriavidus lacunae]|uniref:IucA/IucC family siderophore biosynthesis protein n=1 Tax=Cupriavidus lacunae TaxID=2666307 RepID=A0A370NWJ6_9BURK|nr:IucA/IucC family protein [Cupriavidus lacunae]RDK09965.1 IucA/IucC family siderophore biosynthesis protein [Cupriavidus lacunae]
MLSSLLPPTSVLPQGRLRPHCPDHDVAAPDAIERRLIEQFFNTYCRETGIVDPRRATHLPAPMPAALQSTLARWRAEGLEPAVLALADRHGGHRWLAAALAYVSPIGYHRLADAVLSEGSVFAPVFAPLRRAEKLADAITEALAHAYPQSVATDWPARFAALMKNGIRKVRQYHREAPARQAPSRFIAAEQGLRFGHIFHATSKASEGFSADALQRYAPELGAAFQLHYFAVASEQLESGTIDGQPLPIDPAVMETAADLLKEGDYRLLPCHPWQAGQLLSHPGLQPLLASRAMISLGPLGELAWPTSSVRTVWLPQQQRFLKLALDIRITNFVRNNPPEHVRRALDASRAIAMLPEAARSSAHFTVLAETGYAVLALPDNALRASTAVIYRQGMTGPHGDAAQVLATVLEESAQGTGILERLLHEALGHRHSTADIRRWWASYLDVTLLPLARLFADHGISLEAHLQNSMVAFEGGWPVHGYVRDMEGASISRTRFAWAAQFDADSPVLYTEEAALHRFAYYVLVNHIGHFIACLARTGACDEATLWRDTAAALDAGGPSLRHLLASLQALETLPAKANMLSCFGRHGETPAWAGVPNFLVSAPQS